MDLEFISPKLERPTEESTAEGIAPVGETQGPPDGIRILPVAPLEKAKYYSHSVGSRLDVLQAFEGIVTDVDLARGEFTARLDDLTNTLNDPSEAVFDLREVSSNDHDLLKVGAVFRWMIGYRKHNFGQQERVSALVFRRLPAWYGDDLASAAEYGEQLAQAISIE